jgi:hypothetical protein
MLDYLLAGSDEMADESYLIRADILDSSFYCRRTHSVTGIFSHPQTNAVKSENEVFFLPLFFDNDGTLVASSIDEEVARLRSTAANTSISTRRGVFDDRETRRSRTVPCVTPVLCSATLRKASSTLRFDNFEDQRVVEFPGLGCDLLVDEARVVPRRKFLCYAGICGLRTTDCTSSERSMLGRYVTDVFSGDFVFFLRLGQDFLHIGSTRYHRLNCKHVYGLVCKRESADAAFRSGLFVVAPHALLSDMYSREFRRCPLCSAPPEHLGCHCTLRENFHEAMLRPGGMREYRAQRANGEFIGTAHETVAIRSTADNSGHCSRANFCRPVRIVSCFPIEDGVSLSELLVYVIQRRLLANVPASAAPTSSLLCLSYPDEKGEYAQKLNESHESLFNTYHDYEGDLLSKNLIQSSSELANSDSCVLSTMTSRSEALAAISKEILRKAHAKKLRNRVSALKSNEKRAEKFRKLTTNVKDGRKQIALLKQREEVLLAENKRLNDLASRS